MAYFSNGSEGSVLDAQCNDCSLGWGWDEPDQKRLFDDDFGGWPCPVAFVQMEYNYSQMSNAPLKECLTHLVDDEGACKVRALLSKTREVSQ